MQFQKAYPELTQNLRVNSNRLTTPYDLHITLRHILNLSVKKKFPAVATGCRMCRSLFHEIPIVRTCGDVNIPHESCPCSFEGVSVSKLIVKFAAQHAVDTLNKKLKSKKTENGEDCAILRLRNVTLAKHQLTSPWNLNYVVEFNVTPSNGQFEALLKRKFSSIVTHPPQFELLQEIVHTNIDKEPIVCVPKSQLSKNVGQRSKIIDSDVLEL